MAFCLAAVERVIKSEDPGVLHMAAKKYRIEVSPEHHKALSIQAAKAGMRLKDYVSPFLDQIIEPETKDFGTIKSESPKVQEPPPPPKDPEVLKSEDPLILAKHFILSEMDAGREPTVKEVATKVGITSRHLGRLMSNVGIQAVNCRRKGKAARRYTFELREKIGNMTQ